MLTARVTILHISGEVQIPLGSVDLASDNLRMWKEIKEPPKNVLGDICFSLRYVAKKSTLTCMIIECKNLKAMDVLTGASDPYVKMNLMQGGKRVKKQKTSVKMKNVNPYYNESFKFEVRAADIQRSELNIFVMDFDRVGSNDAIGWLKLSMAEQTSAGKHWRDMIQSNGRSIAQWHSLQPFDEDEEKEKEKAEKKK